ncbi:flavodoxin domain-containing protein, partial [Parabacteroides distasonis]
MKTIGIFYGSSTGTTEGIAKRIAEKLGVEDKDIHDVSNASPADVAPYEILLLGCST